MKLFLSMIALMVLAPMSASAQAPLSVAIRGAPHPYGVAFDAACTAHKAAQPA